MRIPNIDITYYLSGPISANEKHSVEEHLDDFVNTANNLRDAGYSIVSPKEVCDDLVREMRLEGDQGWQWYMRRDIEALVSDEVSGIAMMGDWRSSKGAMVEMNLAAALGYDVVIVSEMLRYPAQHALRNV